MSYEVSTACLLYLDDGASIDSLAEWSKTLASGASP
jgi:hypothetical protein